ncbi:hypothetical protein [Escherichia coli]|nr:hypothetical protein [Escherichia coli]
MKDVSVLNEMIFSASTENELQEKFEDIYHRINNESEPPRVSWRVFYL